MENCVVRSNNTNVIWKYNQDFQYTYCTVFGAQCINIDDDASSAVHCWKFRVRKFSEGQKRRIQFGIVPKNIMTMEHRERRRRGPRGQWSIIRMEDSGLGDLGHWALECQPYMFERYYTFSLFSQGDCTPSNYGYASHSDDGFEIEMKWKVKSRKLMFYVDGKDFLPVIKDLSYKAREYKMAVCLLHGGSVKEDSTIQVELL